MSLSALSAADLNDLAGRFGRPELLLNGAIHILEFDAIRERSGRRWDLRQDTVREYAERQFEKFFPDEDAFQPLDDVHFLLVQSAEVGFGAQTRALKLLRNVLEYFLGASARADIRLLRVNGIGPEGVESDLIDFTDDELAQHTGIDWDKQPFRSESRSLSEPTEGKQDGGLVLAKIYAEKSGRPAALVGDRTYDALFLTEPIWGVNQKAVVSYLLRSLVFQRQGDSLVEADVEKASVADLVRLDLAVLGEAKRLFDDQGPDRRFALHVPIHNASLGTVSGRQQVLYELEKLQPLASSSVIVVLKGLDGGAPQSRMLELTSLLKGRCRAVIAELTKLIPKIDRWRDSRLSGIAVDLRAVARVEGYPSMQRLTEFADQVKGVAPTLFAYSAPTSPVLLAAWAAGFTHVSGDWILKGVGKDLVSLRVGPADLYRDR